MQERQLQDSNRYEKKVCCNAIQTLGVRGSETQFKCEVPSGKDGKGLMKHPGLVLPTTHQSSQAFFGALPNKAGAPERLRMISRGIPKNIARFMTHDVKSASSSGYSNFRKTQIGFNDSGNVKG